LPCKPTGVNDPRVLDNFTRRFNTATLQALVPIPAHTRNGDEALADKCATYTKCIKQASPGKVDPDAYDTLATAIASGKFSDFENVTLGGSLTLNGPMGSYAKTFCGADSSQFGDADVPKPWKLASEEYAAELIELYWCSLLRDVAFADYNASAQQAAAELSTLPAYQGPRDGTNQVTPALLFRGKLPGETTGPYISQFFLTPTNLGALPFDQRYITYKAGVDYMTDQASWYDVQNGVPTGLMNQKDPVTRYLHNAGDSRPTLMSMSSFRNTSSPTWCFVRSMHL
jgi:hypothetical protein